MQVTKDVHMVSDAEETVNAAFISTARGTVVVDTMRTPKDGELLLGHIKTTTAKPVYMVINSHYHADHTFGNSSFEFPTISTETTYELMKKRLENQWSTLTENNAPLPLPDITFENELKLRFEDISMELVEVGGHAPGTTVVHIPEKSVLIVSDLVFSGRFPFMLDGNLGQWIDVLNELAGWEADYVIPGHGKPGGSEILTEQVKFLQDFSAESRKLVNNNDLDDALNELQKNFEIPSFRMDMVENLLKRLDN